MDLWNLPTSLTVGGIEYPIGWEFREVLSLLALLNDETKPLWQRWFAAVDRFFAEPVPTANLTEACEKMGDFISMGVPGAPGPKLFDWEQDAPEIISDINRVAGFEVRNQEVHWWTFLGWFRAIGEGQLSFLVGIRSKLARGQKLTEGEQEYMRTHRVRLRSPADPEKARLEALLNGKLTMDNGQLRK